MKRSPIRLLVALTVVLLLAVGVPVAAVALSGHTPGRVIDYLEQRLAGHPKLEALALPPLQTVRALLDEPRQRDRLQEPFHVPPPPPAWAAPDAPLPAVGGRVLRVGPGQRLTTIAQAAREARDGDVVEIEAGEYRGDVAVWLQKQLTIRSVGGNARLIADGRSAEGKAIWVLRDGRFDIEGIDFIGVRVADRNGAGIRFEGGELRVRRCLFWGSESGILTSSGGRGKERMSLDVEASEFGYIGDGRGYSHAIYAGEIGRLRVSHSYFHHGHVGHLIKSRAAVNLILHNRLTDEEGGRSSYEVDLSNGGLSLLLGNLIQQSRRTENSALVSFGAEGFRHAESRLYLFNNTLVNDHRWGGAFVRVHPGATSVVAANNLLSGPGRFHGGEAFSEANNPKLDAQAFVDAARHDYRLREPHPELSWRAPAVAQVADVDLRPQVQYRHPRALQALNQPPSRPGALQVD